MTDDDVTWPMTAVPETWAEQDTLAARDDHWAPYDPADPDRAEIEAEAEFSAMFRAETVEEAAE